MKTCRHDRHRCIEAQGTTAISSMTSSIRSEKGPQRSRSPNAAGYKTSHEPQYTHARATARQVARKSLGITTTPLRMHACLQMHGCSRMYMKMRIRIDTRANLKENARGVTPFYLCGARCGALRRATDSTTCCSPQAEFWTSPQPSRPSTLYARGKLHIPKTSELHIYTYMNRFNYMYLWIL